MIDAVAAGCIPLLLGDSLRPPLSAFLKYSEFSVRVPENDFLRYPKETMRTVLDSAVPRIGGMHSALDTMSARVLS